MLSRGSNIINRIDFNKSPSEYPDSDRGNLKLYYELELLKSMYESNESDTYFSRYLAVMDTLGNRGHFIDFSSDLKIDKMTRASDWTEYYDAVIQKPIPSPSAEESQDKFISRCISTLSERDPGREHKQVIAICFNEWRRVKKDEGTPRTDAERAKVHFDISDEEWNKLSDEKKQEYINKLPSRGARRDTT